MQGRQRKLLMTENPILAELVYDQSSGSLLFKGVRYLMIRPETISGIQKAITESCGKEADESFFEGGFTGGSLSAKKYKKLHNYSDLDVIEFMMKMGNQIGWGYFRLERYDPKLKVLHDCVATSSGVFLPVWLLLCLEEIVPRMKSNAGPKVIRGACSLSRENKA